MIRGSFLTFSALAEKTASVSHGAKDKTCGLSRSQERHRFKELDALRGLCTCIVILGHMWFAFGDRIYIPHLLEYSNLSVKLFFALSGNLVAYQYLLDGKCESLLSAIFRRLPRLLIPAFCANLLYWVFSAIGAYSSESTFRKMNSDNQFCIGCIPDDLSVILSSSIRVLWSFKRDHLVWLWTVSHEIFGSVVVFMLAPAFRLIVDSNLWGFDHGIRIGSLMMPQRLHRCIVAYATFLAVTGSIYSVITLWLNSYGTDIPKEAVWCLQLFSIAQTFFLFTAGLAIAHIGIVFAEVEHRISWRMEPTNNLKKSLSWIPIILMVIGAATPFIVVFTETHWYYATGYWVPMTKLFEPLGAIAILAGVSSSPQEVCAAMSRFSPVGQISFSLYLLHMMILYAVGMPLYVWVRPLLSSHYLIFTVVVLLTAGPMLIVSYCFWRIVEDPLGVRLPVHTFKLLWKHRSAVTSCVSKMSISFTNQVRALCA